MLALKGDTVHLGAYGPAAFSSMQYSSALATAQRHALGRLCVLQFHLPYARAVRAPDQSISQDFFNTLCIV